MSSIFILATYRRKAELEISLIQSSKLMLMYLWTFFKYMFSCLWTQVRMHFTISSIQPIKQLLLSVSTSQYILEHIPYLWESQNDTQEMTVSYDTFHNVSIPVIQHKLKKGNQSLIMNMHELSRVWCLFLFSSPMPVWMLCFMNMDKWRVLLQSW